jgi:hypothetical protein
VIHAEEPRYTWNFGRRRVLERCGKRVTASPAARGQPHDEKRARQHLAAGKSTFANDGKCIFMTMVRKPHGVALYLQACGSSSTLFFNLHRVTLSEWARWGGEIARGTLDLDGAGPREFKVENYIEAASLPF